MEANLKDFGNSSSFKIVNKAVGVVGEVSKDEPEAELKIKKGEICQWSEVEKDVFMAVGPSKEILPSGAYKFRWLRGVIVCSKIEVNCDALIDFRDSVFSKVVSEIEHFWLLREKFSKFGFLHKRGYLFYGPAGSGKSCLVQRIMEDIFKKNGVVFLCNSTSEVITEGLRKFRLIEKDRPIVCVYEDLDAIIRDHGEEAVLSLLDGETMIDHVVNLATTNYPDRLDKRIVSRPRRFDQIIKIGMPSEEIRYSYFKHKLKDNEDINEWVSVSKGFSFASMAELVVSVKCLGNSLDESAKRLRKLVGEKHKPADDTGEEIGFL